MASILILVCARSFSTSFYETWTQWRVLSLVHTVSLKKKQLRSPPPCQNTPFSAHSHWLIRADRLLLFQQARSIEAVREIGFCQTRACAHSQYSAHVYEALEKHCSDQDFQVGRTKQHSGSIQSPAKLSVLIRHFNSRCWQGTDFSTPRL